MYWLESSKTEVKEKLFDLLELGRKIIWWKSSLIMFNSIKMNPFLQSIIILWKHGQYR